jgi:hypothetical protein
MTKTREEAKAALDDVLCVRDAKGVPVLTIGLLATFYFEKPWTRPVKEAVAELAEGYIQQFREHLRWTQDPKTAKVHPIEAGRVKLPGAWLPEHPPDEAWWFAFAGGESAAATSPFQVQAYAPRESPLQELGYLQVRLPLHWFTDHPGTFTEFVLTYCKRLKPLSGYAGIGFLQPCTIYGQDDAEPFIWPLAQRHPGIEVDNPRKHKTHLKDGIKGINWLTILGDRWVEAAGGLDYLRMRLDESFVFYPYDGGLMIQAGPRPQMGDATQNQWPERYVTLAKVLKKIQIQDHYPFHLHAPGRMGNEESMAWLFRFDGR